MLRIAVLLVLLANGVFFVWARGGFAPSWPAPRDHEREPGRMAAQVRPETVTVLMPRAASAALTAARDANAVCLQAGPLADTALAAAEATVAAAQMPAGAVVREPLPAPPQWLLASGRSVDPFVRRGREDDLRRLNLAYETLEAPSELAGSLVLSRHANRAAAEAALAAALQPASGAAPRGLRVLSLPAPVPQSLLRVARADAEQQVRLQALPAAALAGGFGPCTAPP